MSVYMLVQFVGTRNCNGSREPLIDGTEAGRKQARSSVPFNLAMIKGFGIPVSSNNGTSFATIGCVTLSFFTALWRTVSIVGSATGTG